MPSTEYLRSDQVSCMGVAASRFCCDVNVVIFIVVVLVEDQLIQVIIQVSVISLRGRQNDCLGSIWCQGPGPSARGAKHPSRCQTAGTLYKPPRLVLRLYNIAVDEVEDRPTGVHRGEDISRLKEACVACNRPRPRTVSGGLCQATDVINQIRVIY